MNISFFKYLVEASVYLGFFLLIYKWFISNLTHFAWMRVFLLSAVMLSVVLPLIVLPGHWFSLIFGEPKIGSPLFLPALQSAVSGTPGVLEEGSQSFQSLNIWRILFLFLTAIYLMGALYKLYKLFRSLLKIRKNIRTNSKYQEGLFWIINLRDELPASSFLNFIFINSQTERLTQEDLQVIINHEQLHARQFHSIDKLVVELYAIVFWFNPFVRNLRVRISEVHEYLADEKMCTGYSSKRDYSNLLLGLTCEIRTCGLTSGFSGKQVCRRVHMLTKSRSANLSRLSFFLILPIAAFLLVSFSYFDSDGLPKSGITHQDQKTVILVEKKVGRVIWEGNTVYSEKRLNRTLGLKMGDPYTKEILENRLHLANDGVSSEYMDNGYLFFDAGFTEKENNEGFVDINIWIIEGARSKIGEIRIIGNEDIPVKDVLDRIDIKQGDWFSRAKVIGSIRSIAEMNKFDPEKIIPQPIPKGTDKNSKTISIPGDVKYWIVDIEYQLTRK